MIHETWMWAGFFVFILAMLALDLGVFHRKSHEVKFREAMGWVAVWVTLAMLFNVFVYFRYGGEMAAQFLAGYLVEYALSVDNIFVFLMLFSYFKVPRPYQHRVLFYGILGAIVMRLVMIFGVFALIHYFEWILYVFGAFLVYTGIKMATSSELEVDPEKNWVLRLFRRFMPVTKDYEGNSFLVRREGRMYATPLFVVLLLVETTDLMFAVDSIPAVMAISRDLFIVTTSNIFAILGLRSLYFAVSGMMKIFHHLRWGLSLILVFIGVKMIVQELGYKLPIQLTLGVIIGVLATCIATSLIWKKKEGVPVVEETGGGGD